MPLQLFGESDVLNHHERIFCDDDWGKWQNREAGRAPKGPGYCRMSGETEVKRRHTPLPTDFVHVIGIRPATKSTHSAPLCTILSAQIFVECCTTVCTRNSFGCLRGAKSATSIKLCSLEAKQSDKNKQTSATEVFCWGSKTINFLYEEDDRCWS